MLVSTVQASTGGNNLLAAHFKGRPEAVDRSSRRPKWRAVGSLVGCGGSLPRMRPSEEGLAAAPPAGCG